MPTRALCINRKCITWNDQPVEYEVVERNGQAIHIHAHLLNLFLRKVQKYVTPFADFLPKDDEDLIEVVFRYKATIPEESEEEEEREEEDVKEGSVRKVGRPSPTYSIRSAAVDRRSTRRR